MPRPADAIKSAVLMAISGMLRAFTPKGFLAEDQELDPWCRDIQLLENGDMELTLRAPAPLFSMWLAANGRILEENGLSIGTYAEAITYGMSGVEPFPENAETPQPDSPN